MYGAFLKDLTTDAPDMFLTPLAEIHSPHTGGSQVFKRPRGQQRSNGE